MAQGMSRHLCYFKSVFKVLFFFFCIINFFTSSIAVISYLWSQIDSVVLAVFAVSGYVLFIPVLFIILLVRAFGWRWD